MSTQAISLARVSKNLTGRCAEALARLLSSTTPDWARSFGFWYRERCVLYPRWLRPIPWESRVRLENGATVLAPFREVQGMSLILNRWWEPSFSRRLLDTLGEGDVFVDIGANIGYYTLLASRAVGPGGVVLSFEPSVKNLGYLLKNIEANPIKNVVVFSEALSDRSGIAKLSAAPEFNWGICSLRDDRTPNFTLTSTRTLDDVLGALGLGERPLLVKIDTEGTEMQVLRGMERLLGSSPTIQVMCEVSPQWSRADAVLSYMSERGFRGEHHDGGGWAVMADGFVPETQCDVWFSRP